MNTTTRKYSIFKSTFGLLALILLCANAFGQEAQTTEHEEEQEKKFRIAVALGHGFLPQASTSSRDLIIVPTFGLDLQYWFGHRWGVAIKSDVEISNYIIDQGGEEGVIERETPFIVSIPILFKPFDNELEFILGPGIEIEENENFSIFRLGVGYEFEIGHNWDFSPEFVYDLKNVNINSWTIAFGVGRKF